MTQTFVSELGNFFRALFIAETAGKSTVPVKVKVDKPKKEIIYKADVKACEEYLRQRQVDKGMHNLTTKFHKNC